jgi:hypothetical protein
MNLQKIVFQPQRSLFRAVALQRAGTEDSEKYLIFQDVNSVISVSSVAKIALLQLHHLLILPDLLFSSF